MFDDCILENFVGNFPFNWTTFTAKFLQFPNHRISVVVIRNRVNRGVRFFLEISADYVFYGDSRVA